MAGADLANSLEVARGRSEAATSILYGFQKDDGHGLGTLAQDGPLDLIRRPHAEGIDVISVDGSSIEVGVGYFDRTRN